MYVMQRMGESFWESQRDPDGFNIVAAKKRIVGFPYT